MLDKLTTIIVSHKDFPLPNQFTIQAVNTCKNTNQQLLNDIGRLRYSVWLAENMKMPKDKQTLIDEIDHNAILWAIYKQDEIVATARLNIYNDISQSPTSYMHQEFNHLFEPPTATFTRLVVDKQCRGLSFGKMLDNIRLAQAKLMNLKSVLLMCPLKRAEHLQKQGYENLGKAKPSKLWPNADWYLMRKVL